MFLLQNGHKFKDDPEYGRLVDRFSNGTVTERYIELINSRLLNDGMGDAGNRTLPKGNTLDIYYAYYSNDERNYITTNIFSEYMNTTHQDDDNNVDLNEIPKDVVIIESALFDKNGE